MEFPQYRKLNNNKHYYKIISNEEFEELIIIGRKVIQYRKKANIYPDLVMISDLLNVVSPQYKVSNAEEYGKILKLKEE